MEALPKWPKGVRREVAHQGATRSDAQGSRLWSLQGESVAKPLRFNISAIGPIRPERAGQPAQRTAWAIRAAA